MKNTNKQVWYLGGIGQSAETFGGNTGTSCFLSPAPRKKAVSQIRSDVSYEESAMAPVELGVCWFKWPWVKSFGFLGGLPRNWSLWAFFRVTRGVKERLWMNLAASERL